MEEPSEREWAMLDVAAQLPAAAREIYLKEACGDDLELRRRIESLVESDQRFIQVEEHQPRPVASKPPAPFPIPIPGIEKPGDQIGPYKLLKKIAEGGMGIVYKAEQREPIRRGVAIKVIKPGMDSKQVLGRFEAERQALAMMDHPNIAKVFDAGATQSGRPFFVMELVEGIRITDYCNDNKLSTSDRLKLFIQICEAIEHAHQKGIIHRDIKPSNILVTLRDGVRVTKVIDFGIAKATRGLQLTDKTVFTGIEQFIGTPAYMSPEQAEMTGLDIDTRSDIYSLGVLLFELLTGITPFDTPTLTAGGVDKIRRIIREEEPPRPSEALSTMDEGKRTSVARQRQCEPLKLVGLIRGDLDWIVMKTLEKDRTRRYGTASGLALDVARHLNGEPVEARPPTKAYRLGKLLHKHGLAIGMIGLFVVLLVASSIVSLRFLIVANRERAKAFLAEGQAQQRANAEAQAKTEALVEKRRAEQALGRLQAKRAQDLFAQGDSSEALANLSDALRRDPANHILAERLLSALVDKTYLLPFTPPMKHSSEVCSAHFSPDGTALLTASRDGTALVWDAHTGQYRSGPFRHLGAVLSAQFSPDGTRILTASEDATACVWEVQTGRLLAGPFRHLGPVLSAQFSPDGSRILTASEDTTACVWEVLTGRLLTGDLRHAGSVLTAQFSPDGERIVTASADRTARVWDAQSGRPLTAPFTHSGSVLWAEFSPDGQSVATASADRTARVWNVKTGQPRTDKIWLSGSVLSARFSPDGRKIVTASQEPTFRVWDAQTGQPVTEPVRHSGMIASALFSPSGNRILTASADGTARVWDGRTGKPLTELLKHSRDGNTAQFAPDGSRIVTTSKDGTARVWDARKGQRIVDTIVHPADISSAQFSSDGRRILTASRDHIARVWDTQTGRLISGPLRHSSDVIGAHFDVDGSQVLTVDAQGDVCIWDAWSGVKISEPIRQNQTVYAAQFSSDGRRLVTASGDSVSLWDIKMGHSFTEPLHNSNTVTCLQLSSNGSRVGIASSDFSVRVLNGQTGQPVSTSIRHSREVSSIEFSLDATRIVTASLDGTARVWNSDTGIPLTPPLRHSSDVVSAHFSPDGSKVVTASDDGTARVWNAQTGEPLAEPLVHAELVIDAAFSPDGRRVATASVDGTAVVWDAQSGQPLAEPLRLSSHASSVRFGPDGQYLLAVSRKTTTIWLLPALEGLAPEWLPRLAEAIGGWRFDTNRVLEPTPGEEIDALRSLIFGLAPSDRTVRWAQWFLSDRATRNISPESSMTGPQYVQQCIEMSTVSSLAYAVDLAPENALAWAKLGVAILREKGTADASQIAEAEWCAHQAISLQKQRPEVQREVDKIRQVLER